MSDYVSYKKKSQAIDALSANSTSAQLFADDLGRKGAKSWIVSTPDHIYSMIYAQNGKLKSIKSYYEVFSDDHQIAFGIDGDFKTTEDKFAADHNCGPELLSLINKVNAFVLEKFKKVVTLRDWIITKAPYCNDKKKHSFHLKLTAICFDTVKDVKDFAVALDMSDEGVDYSIYRKQPFRLTGCTKKGQRRQLVPYRLSADGKSTLMPSDFDTHLKYWKATLVTNTEDHVPVSIPAEMKQTIIARLKHHNKAIVDLELGDLLEDGCDMSISTVTGLVNCIARQRADEYPQWFNVCSAIQRTQHPDKASLFKLFDEFSKKSPDKYDEAATKKMWNDCTRSVANAPQIKADQLLNIARKDNRAEYQFVIDTTHLPQLLAKEFEIDYSSLPRRGHGQTTDGLTIEYDEYDAEHCKDVPANYDIVIQIAGMGAGKSVGVTNYIKRHGPRRILKPSPRIKYSEDAQRRYGEIGVDMKLYWQQEGILSDVDKLIISPESIYRLFRDRGYDLVDGDEIESLLRQFSSDTMEHLPQSLAAFVDILYQAKKVIISDAHFSARSLDFLKTVFASTTKKVLILRNTRKVVKRRAIEHVITARGHGNLTRNQDKFIDDILEDIRQGKNVGVHASSKKFADRLSAAVEASGLLAPEQWRYYHGKQAGSQSRQSGVSHDFETEVIENVNEAWKGLRLVMWTPCITVGVSYDCDKDQVKKDFDCMYVYLTAKSVNANVAMQGCQRIRHLNDDLLHFMIDDLPTRSCVTNLDLARRALEQRRKELEVVYEEIVMNHDQTPNWYLKKLLEEHANDPVALQEALSRVLEQSAKSPTLQAPKILLETLAYNKLENDLHHMHLRGFFYDCLHKEGFESVQRKDVILEEGQQSRNIARETTEHTFDSLPLISLETHVEYVNKKKKHTDTTYTNAAVDKFMFVTKLVKDAAVSAQDQQALFDDFQVNDQHKEWLFHAYNACRRLPLDILIKDMTKRPYLETTKADGAITYRILQVIELLGLRSCHDTERAVTRQRIEQHLPELLKLVVSAKILMDKPKMDVHQAEKKAIPCSGSDGAFRKVTRGVKTIFSTWLGLSFDNIADREAKNKGVPRPAIYKLSHLDDFSSLLYTCGLVGTS